MAGLIGSGGSSAYPRETHNLYRLWRATALRFSHMKLKPTVNVKVVVDAAQILRATYAFIIALIVLLLHK